MAVNESLPAVPLMDLGANLQAGIITAKRQNQALMQLMGELLEVGVDYDRIPGTPKPTLLQPGAQQLCTVFHFCPSYQVADKTEILEAGCEFLSYIIVCRLTHRDSGMIIAEGIGSANSRETKHRYRKEGGQRVENVEIWDLQNTLVKMAKKRALVDASLNATGASRLFTQDLEDLRAMAQGDGETSDRQNRSRPAQSAQSAGNAPLRSDKQANLIMGILKRKHGVEDAGDIAQVCEILAGATLDKLTSKQASNLIDRLQALQDAAALDAAMAEAAAKRESEGGER